MPNGIGGHFRLRNDNRRSIRKVTVKARCRDGGPVPVVIAEEAFGPPDYLRGLTYQREVNVPFLIENCVPARLIFEFQTDTGFPRYTHAICVVSLDLPENLTLSDECRVIFDDTLDGATLTFECPGMEPPELTVPCGCY